MSGELGAVQVLRGLRANRERPDLDSLAAESDPERFVRRMLPHAARSFAASIVMLPREQARAASVAYLYCRMLDTYEDLLPDREAKFRELTAFGARLEPLYCGGETRRDSVYNGLVAAMAAVAADDWVLVHDAARCLVTPAQIDALIDACRDDAVGGLLALPLADTLKRAEDGRVAATLDRGDKWLAQTPQMFRIGPLAAALRLALQADAAAITDEASAMEAAGLQPLLVRGSAQNFKVTYPEDFALAEAILRSRQ